MQQNITNTCHRQKWVVRVYALTVVNNLVTGQPRSAAEMEVIGAIKGPQLIKASSGNAGQLSVGTKRGYYVRGCLP
ncbi:hypothetical protein ACFUOZ_06390 [Paenarthrobacter sp. NPDC057355]|uniref:hypothetical protein n=1 Tax=Paenarthrobacter sp. NPDC057355 TaxID=3346105 RepID=UPI00362F9CD5